MLIIGTKAKHFDLVQKYSYRKQIVSVLAQNSGTKQSNLICSRNCLGQNRTFLYNPKTYRSKQNIMFDPLIIETKAKRLNMVRLLSNEKRRS